MTEHKPLADRIEVVRVELAAIATASTFDAERAAELREWADNIDRISEEAFRSDVEGHLLDLRRILHRFRKEESLTATPTARPPKSEPDA